MTRTEQPALGPQGNQFIANRPDLDASRIYYLGQSFGAMWGMFSFANEPAIRAAVFAAPTGTLLYDAALAVAPGMRAGLGELLAGRTPSPLNPPHGRTSVDGIAVAPPHFDESLPLRNRPPLDAVPGATEVQRVIDGIVWAAQFTSTVAVAPLLRRAPRPR